MKSTYFFAINNEQYDWIRNPFSANAEMLTKELPLRIQKIFFEIRNDRTLKARLQPFTVLFSFSAILVCFIDAQIHSCFREKMNEFERQ